MRGPTTRTPGIGKQDPVLGKVGGEEDDEDHLDQLRRLAADRPDVQGEPAPVDVAPEHERQGEQREPAGRPRVAVEPQPAVRSHDHRSRRRDREGDQEPGELEGAEPELEGPELLGHEVLGKPFHQEEPDAAEEAGRRQEDLVETAAGERQRDMRQEQRAEVDDQAGRVRRTDGSRPGEPERQASHDQGGARGHQQGKLARPGPRARERGKRRRSRSARDAHATPRSRRNRTSPIAISSPNPRGAVPETTAPFT